MPTVVVTGQSIQRVLSAVGTYTITLAVSDGTLTGTAQPLTVEVTSAATSLGRSGSWSRTGIYALASMDLGLGSFSQISEMDSGNKRIFDDQWGYFLPTFIDEWCFEDFIREIDLDDTLKLDFDAVTVRPGQNFNHFYFLPDDGIAPVEVDRVEEVYGSTTTRWQWMNVTYNDGTNEKVSRVIGCHKDSPVQCRFTFVPFTPPNHDQEFDHKIRPAVCRFMAVRFAIHLQKSMGEGTVNRRELDELSDDLFARTKANEAQTGSARRRRDGALNRVRQPGVWR